MKKFIVAILTLLYLSSSTGATVYTHYCMDKLAECGLGNSKSKNCGKCGMEKNDADSKGCCKDEHKFVKNISDQKVVEASFQLMKVMGSALTPSYAELPSILISSVTEKNPVSNAPPRSIGVAVYILNRTFLI